MLFYIFVVVSNDLDGIQCKQCNNNYPGYLTNGGVSTVMDNSMRDEQGDKTYCMSNYSRETMKLMFVMRSHLMLTDVVLEVQHELFHAHKLVLSAASPYFKAMFTSGLKESEMSRVKLEGVSYIWCQNKLITYENCLN